MDVLPEIYRTLYYCGIWSEDDQKQRLIKMIYRTFVVTLIFFITLSELIELTTIDNIAHLTECLFLTLTFLSLCAKIVNFIIKQKSMNFILNSFRHELCQPRNPDEEEIISRHRNMASFVFKIFMSFATVTGLFLNMVPIANRKRELPFGGYQPVSLENTFYFTVAYFLQAVCSILSIIINVALDILLAGCILLVCGNFELCTHRILVSSEKKTFGTIKDNIRHHVMMLHVVKKIESVFMIVIVTLFMLSLITICTSLFQLPQKKIGSVEFCTLILYLSCILLQVFFYCWFGNALETKSSCVSDALYNSDWTTLKPAQRRIYFTSMLANQNKLTISFYGPCSLSLETYVWILKTSYAAFNLLESTSST